MARPRTAEPVQARAHATREHLIKSAAELLGEVGVERLSTNLICERAGVTPPAFYRYFTDKYGVLAELGERLMEAQNQAIESVLVRGAQEMAEVSEADLRAIILETIAITKAFPGGPWVLRVLRAVPALHHVRLDSHRRMAALVAKALAGRGRKGAALKARLLIDMGYAAIELAFDEPHLSRAALAASAAAAIAPLLD